MTFFLLNSGSQWASRSSRTTRNPWGHRSTGNVQIVPITLFFKSINKYKVDPIMIIQKTFRVVADLFASLLTVRKDAIEDDICIGVLLII